MTDAFNEKRKGIRVDFETQLVLKTYDSEINLKGSSKDLSIKGIFVKTQKKIPIGTKCQIEITLSGTSEEIRLNMQGTVARNIDSGLGIAFDSIDLDSYTHLKNIVMYNSLDPDSV